MADDGIWRDYCEGSSGKVVGSALTLLPVFRAEVFYGPDKQGGGECFWWAVLNGKRLMGSRTIENAKACIDATISNELRQIREGYQRVMARLESWDNDEWK